MNKRIASILLVLLVGLIFGLSGCTTSSSSGDVNYRTGSRALELSLINPGFEDYFEGDELIILVEYFNRGTADISGGEFFVSGYDTKYLNLNLDPKFITIDGKDEYNPEGKQSQIMTVRSNSLRMPKETEEFHQTVKLTACYPYKTTSTAKICIDPDPNNRRVQNKVCTMNAISPGAQGAPLVVTRVEPMVSKNNIRFDIEIANQGDGILYDRTVSNQKCFADLDKYDDVNKVDVLKVEYSGHRLNCLPRNPVRLIDGRAKITCECEGCLQEFTDAYETLVTMEFSYGYRNEIIKKFRILSE